MMFPIRVWKHVLEFRGMECLGSREHKRLVKKSDQINGLTGQLADTSKVEFRIVVSIFELSSGNSNFSHA